MHSISDISDANHRALDALLKSARRTNSNGNRIILIALVAIKMLPSLSFFLINKIRVCTISRPSLSATFRERGKATLAPVCAVGIIESN